LDLRDLDGDLLIFLLGIGANRNFSGVADAGIVFVRVELSWVGSGSQLVAVNGGIVLKIRFHVGGKSTNASSALVEHFSSNLIQLAINCQSKAYSWSRDLTRSQGWRWSHSRGSAES